MTSRLEQLNQPCSPPSSLTICTLTRLDSSAPPAPVPSPHSSACCQVDAHPPHPAVSDAARRPADAQRSQAAPPPTHALAARKRHAPPASRARPAVQRREERGPAPEAGRPAEGRLVHLVVVLGWAQAQQEAAVQPVHHLPEQQEEQEQLQEQQLADPHRGARR